MRTLLNSLAVGSLALATPLAVTAAESVEIPDDAVAINGVDLHETTHAEIMEALYGPTDWHFEVQQAPRYLFVDKQGRVALGIGGKLKGTLQYDFDGSAGGNGSFVPNDIPVPMDPANRSGFNGTVNNSLIYLRLVGHSSKLGNYGAYIETQFSGGDNGDQFYLKQAWANIGYLRAGLATSVFNDDDAAPYTIDEQGPAGGSCTENVAVQWTPMFGESKALSLGVGIEVPQADYTTDGTAARSINQRVPDIPVYFQYAWDDRASRVRLSAILRNLAYRNDLVGKNKNVTGWGVGLSGTIASLPRTTFYYQALYGKGIAQYINDQSGAGYDLVPVVGQDGKLHAPGSLGFFAGVQYDICDKLFVSGTYSQSRLYDQEGLGADGYRYGQYVAATVVCAPVNGLECGLEYLWGKRTNINHEAAHANRVMLMAAYSF